MNFYYCLDLSRAGTRTHEKVSNWLKTGHENHQTRSTGTRGREPAPAYIHGYITAEIFLIITTPYNIILCSLPWHLPHK